MPQSQNLSEFRPSKSFTSVITDPTPNILIVDDRHENLLATERVLKHLNAGLFKATTGNEALSLMLRHRFALVLLDVQMPDMDGFETAKLMQEQEQMLGTPIIFVTALSKEEKYATQAAEIGAVDYIFKPINPDILRSKVKVYLDLYAQREQILALNDVLRKSNEELERFAYICSHDMQEPARMMHSYAEMLIKKFADKLDEKGVRYLHFIVNNAQHMQKMIRDILSFARVGWEAPDFEKVSCEACLSEVLEEFELLIASRQAFITRDPLPTLYTSSTLMRILFQNLIGNALKFQAAGVAPRISITCQEYLQHWQFCISDNGIGIEPAFGAKVFAIFQRIHSKEDYPGTGIGLSTCKKLIEHCGGKIWYESMPGQGTQFFFTIPR